MMCQNCNKKQATTFIKKNINGVITETALCSDCARKLNATQMPFSFGDFFSGFLSDFDPSPIGMPDVKTCPLCGSTFADIAESGKVGCPKCYEVFEENLMPTVRRIHPGTVHKGKKPGSASIKIDSGESETDRIEALKNELNRCIEEQNFERAAELRDEINEMTKEEGKDNE